jgi:hypothetical protein
MKVLLTLILLVGSGLSSAEAKDNNNCLIVDLDHNEQ